MDRTRTPAVDTESKIGGKQLMRGGHTSVRGWEVQIASPHFSQLAARCGASTLACRVGTHPDTSCVGDTMPEASVAKRGDAARKSVYWPKRGARIEMKTQGLPAAASCVFESACATTFAESAVRNAANLRALHCSAVNPQFPISNFIFPLFTTTSASQPPITALPCPTLKSYELRT